MLHVGQLLICLFHLLVEGVFPHFRASFHGSQLCVNQQLQLLLFLNETLLLHLQPIVDCVDLRHFDVHLDKLIDKLFLGLFDVHEVALLLTRD